MAGLWILLSAGSWNAAGAEEAGPIRQVAEFYRAAGNGFHANYTVRLEGVICWVAPEGKTFILQDDSGAISIRAGVTDGPFKAGQRVRVEGDCSAERNGLGFVMTQAFVVANDGLHPPVEKAGSVNLPAGLNPVRVTWFNSRGAGVLNVSYQGPSVPRQPVPNEALFHLEAAGGQEATNVAPGLTYRCWEGEWDFVPNFDRLQAVTNGVAAGLDVGVRTRPERVAMEFTGLLKVPQDGLYTFFAESDDGCLLFVGAPSLRVTPLGTAELPKPRALAIGQALTKAEGFHLSEVEGVVSFVDERQKALRLELKEGEGRLLLEVADAQGAQPRRLLGSRLRAVGICQGTATLYGRQVAGYLWAPSWKEVCLLSPPETSDVPQTEDGKLPLLTTIAQVRKLSSEAAGRAYPARLRGIVTAKFENGPNLVIQDADEGIYIGVPIGNTRGPVEIGVLCEVTGTTRGAAWAPMVDAQRVVRLGLARLPDPLHPSWDQILNGSLDAQYVELQGIVTDVHQNGVKLYTRLGKLELDLAGKSPAEWKGFQDALVRVRGCVLAIYDRTTRLALSGKIRFIHPAISVDEFPPEDPFAAPLKKVAALRSFDPQAGTFQRVRVAGQVVYACDGLYCLMDGTNGLRFFPRAPADLRVGALVEVAGFLDLSGPSPALREALVRQSGRQELPLPEELAETNLLSGAWDATLVRVESHVLHLSRQADEQVLELRTGPYVHSARLNAKLGVLPAIPIGSRLAVTGVYLGKGGNWAAGQDIENFDLTLNSPADLMILEKPSWWTPHRLLALAGGLGGSCSWRWPRSGCCTSRWKSAHSNSRRRSRRANAWNSSAPSSRNAPVWPGTCTMIWAAA